jgi:hypothetical protein
MLALDLFDNEHERRLAEGAVDQLEQRRIDDLVMKMDDLAQRARVTKDPAHKAGLAREFQRVKDERDSYYKVREAVCNECGMSEGQCEHTNEAGIPGNVPVEKIPGKEDLLKGKGRSYYEDQKKNSEPVDEHGGGIGPKQRWQDLMPEQMNPEDYEDEDEDEDDRLRSGDYVRDTQDGESGEVFRMQGDPYERRVRILDRDGKGWYIEPNRLTRVDPQDPDVQRYFGKNRQRDMDESANPKLDQLIKMIQAGKITAASLKDPALRPRLTQLVQQADPQADIAQLVATYAPAAQVKATNVNDLKAQARSGNVMAPLPKTSAGTPSYAQRHATFEQGVVEGKADYNFDAEDLKRLERIRDLPTLKTQALALISKPSAKPMKPEKVEWFKNALDSMNSPIKVIKLMYDLLLSGEGHAVVGSKSSMNPNSYRQRFGEQGVAEGADQVKKVFKDKAGKPVGEIGIDPESSPGNGEWYVHHYATGYSVVGFDSAAEAKRELLYVHKHPDAVEGHPSTKEQGMAEGWSDAMVARRTGTPRTPYSVYIKGRKWKDFENDDHAEAVANKLRAKFKAEGRDPSVITVAPPDISEARATKTRLDPKCWTGKKIGNPKTKVKGGVRVNNCVPAESINEEQDSSGVERAILNRIMVAHTDLLMKFGPEKVMQAAEEVAYDVGDVDEIGTSDVSAYVQQVKQILGAV